MQKRLPIDADMILVGQTPPPVHGQALAIERLVNAEFRDLRVSHVRMDFSSKLEDVGRFQLRKLARLVSLVAAVLYARLRTGARVLYYPPAGPKLVPVLRDMIFLLAVRPFFRAVIFDLHAEGIAGMEMRLPLFLRLGYRIAYYRPRLLITRYPQSDAPLPLRAQELAVVPYGIPDEYHSVDRESGHSRPLTLLYVGHLMPSKGVFILLSALRLLRDRGVDVRAVLVGEPPSESVRRRLTSTIETEGLEDLVRLTGRRTGIPKWEEFAAADVFCFPSHYENEAFPIAILEAMQFELPVIASEWRGIPTMIVDGETGYTIPPRDPGALADRVQQLATQPHLRLQLGKAARQRYLERYTEEVYLSSMERHFLHVVHGAL